MRGTGVKRKLAVVLAADVEGYSRLMGADEEATLKALGAYRDIIDGLIASHDERVFGTAGDSVVAAAVMNDGSVYTVSRFVKVTIDDRHRREGIRHGQ